MTSGWGGLAIARVSDGLNQHLDNATEKNEGWGTLWAISMIENMTKKRA